MSKKRYRPEEIIGKLREADVLLSQGKKVVDVIKALGVTDVTYYRWRQEFGGMSVSQVMGSSNTTRRFPLSTTAGIIRCSKGRSASRPFPATAPGR